MSKRAKSDRVRVAVVRWFDASYERGECTLDELQPRVELVTAGVLVREDAETISVCLDYHPPTKADPEPVFRHVVHIPKVNVISVRRLKG